MYRNGGTANSAKMVSGSSIVKDGVLNNSRSVICFLIGVRDMTISAWRDLARRPDSALMESQVHGLLVDARGDAPSSKSSPKILLSLVIEDSLGDVGTSARKTLEEEYSVTEIRLSVPG
jgi:hypothetical protein